MTPEAQDRQWTCGKGLAANSTLPAAIASVLGALADVLEHHMTALPEDDAIARREYAAYAALVVRTRTAMSETKALASEMAGYVSLPAAPHVASVLNEPRAQQLLDALVEREKELSRLLTAFMATRGTAPPE